MPHADHTKRIALPRIRLASHRSFRNDTAFDFHPLTLLYGRNQAGKSTLLRLLPLLGDSLVSRSGPLDMTSPALCGVGFKELGWLGPEYEATQRFAFSTNEESLPLHTLRIDMVDDGGGPIVNRVSALSDSSMVFDATLDSRPTGAHLGDKDVPTGKRP